ncbi:WEB family protein At5g55860 [Dioscorea cayenensis subsp. rotundata]|uniref:WEB family protein At5g55860 n=1 Tax=Dioscorea cayennensis subsp. rotundata TaxID=55577 RepID=A0AB40CP63_DIOCR|nr:WEB family protein At5g55860 [Dioscorea cayenensis subsp. rotundata]XP_039141879.1 WEB family protein At5g55860 [Dioscorea cayenensis subsp. rotundata]XP_039141880.1 WEB family protein At5g55860 [Dioscorea cayenensis subsp. rotundata]
MGMRTRQNATDSPKAEVGEIDTRAPFESVKAAVSLFGEVAFSTDKLAAKKAKTPPTERTLAKETELHLAQKELNKLKEQLSTAETTKSQALVELDIAKRTVDELTQKLNIINESKESALKSTEEAKNQTKQLELVSSGERTGQDGSWKQELNSSREQYAVANAELDAAKQELRLMRKDFDMSIDAKMFALNQETEAKHLIEANKEKVAQFSKEIADAQESLVHVKLATEQAQQEEFKIISEKDSSRQSQKQSLEETLQKLTSLKKEFDPELYNRLEAKLTETTAEIEGVQKELESGKASDLEHISDVTMELDGAKEMLQKIAEEESSLQNLVDSLKLELEAVQKDHSELKQKDAEVESIIGSLHVKLRKCKAELEAAMATESKTTLASDELVSALQQLSIESENAQREGEAMLKNAEELRNEADAAHIALEDTERKLQLALKEAEEAKAAEVKALDQIKVLSERTNAARASTSDSGANITISAEEYESLSRKVEESEKLAEMKVAAAVAQVEAVRASENEAVTRLEAIRKETKEVETATEEALKRAEMSEAAKKAVEGELRRWREKEQKRAAETASRILTETQMSTEASPPRPRDIPIQEKTDETRKAHKSHASKKILLPSLSGIFHRKKSHSDVGSPSYLPNEKHGVEVKKGKKAMWTGSSGASTVPDGHQQSLSTIITDEERGARNPQVITRAKVSSLNLKKDS